MTFGERLREIRWSKGLNQKDLARQAGIDVTYLSKVETGKMDPPAENTVRRLASALDEEPTELLVLAKKIPSDVREIVTASPEVSYFLRTAKEQDWGPTQWSQLRKKTLDHQLHLFDDPPTDATSDVDR